MRYILLLFALFLFVSCNNKSVQKPNEISKIEWKFDTFEDEFLIPHTSIHLIVNDHEIEIDSALNIQNIEKKDWSNLKIPDDALIACGGWWAGGGSYFYVKKEGDNLIIYRSFVDESISADDSYKYEIIKNISLKDLK